ncbi:interferon omega-1-like [Leopardus geoffroyi]|uniref:interferon omega-1-like n=1 Tax=Leopardus geoffroyi TaxID=46844 RepID=UPI001E25FF58|nr:interferon omega-1-like [Leopardus geoffroyi]
MALLRPLLTALALLACRPGGSLGCGLPGSQAQVSRDNLVLLGQMRRLSPFSCLRARKDFRFPREMLEGGQLREAQAAAAVLRELLQQTFNLLHTERSSAAWSPAPLHGLRSGLHRQLEALDACLVQATGEGERAPGMHGPALAIKRYFQDIRVYLEDEGYSDCAWEIVRLEIMRALSSSATLQDSLAIKDGDLGSP